MQANFVPSLARVLVYEGGKVDDPRDPGGRTNQGVTQATYNAYRRSKGLAAQDVYEMADAERDDIYDSMYWEPIQGDNLPVGLDFAMFDAAVNSGVGHAGIWLQQSLGASYTGNQDGIIGNKTMQAVQDFGDMESLVENYCSHRLATLKRLGAWSIYGKGWAARIANVQKIALSWIVGDGASPVIHPVDVSQADGNKKAPVGGNIQSPPLSQITTHIATGAGAAGTVAAQSAQQITPLQEIFGWMKYVLAGLTIIGVVAGILVKIATTANDAAEKGSAKAIVDLDADAGFVAVKVIQAPVVTKPASAVAPIAAPAAGPAQGG